MRPRRSAPWDHRIETLPNLFRQVSQLVFVRAKALECWKAKLPDSQAASTRSAAPRPRLEPMMNGRSRAELPELSRERVERHRATDEHGLSPLEHGTSCFGRVDGRA